MNAHESNSDRPHADAARLDPEDADRLATEHGETDFAGFPGSADAVSDGTGPGETGSDDALTATEEAAVDATGIRAAAGAEDDRTRPHPS